MKAIFLTLGLLLFLSFDSLDYQESKEEKEINQTLDAWHKAAAEAKYDLYFNFLTEDAIFIGTDALENWNKKAFQDFAKPYFDKGKAWNFKALERHIYFDKSKKLAWFDELLNTQMKICRGSGVLVKVGKEWKIKHYVLSMTIPNEKADEVVKIKETMEDIVIKNFQSKK